MILKLEELRKAAAAVYWNTILWGVGGDTLNKTEFGEHIAHVRVRGWIQNTFLTSSFCVTTTATIIRLISDGDTKHTFIEEKTAANINNFGQIIIPKKPVFGS